jgi:tape measure domain-containing protein
MDSNPIQVTFEFAGNLGEEAKRVTATIRGLQDESADTFRRLLQGSDQAADSLMTLGKVAGSVFSVYQLKEFSTAIIRVRGEFQQMETVIETLLGSKEKADALMMEVRRFAAISPLELKDVSAATQMLLGFNIEAEKVPRFLNAIGDVSMGDAQKFNSLTLAFSQMSATGKLMGGDLNQMINAGFNPLSIMAETTGKSISVLKDEMSKSAITAGMVQQAFIDATSAGGKFYQMSENASKTINGQLSMLQDAIDSVFNELGKQSEGVILSSIQSATKLVENYETIGKVLLSLIATYGVYRAAVALNIAAESGWTLSQLANYRALLLVEKAQKLLNATMLSNPYVLIATLVVGMVTALWALHDSTTAEEKAQARLNEELEKTKERKNALISKTNELTGRLQDETQTVYEQIKALKELKKELPEVFGNMTLEEVKSLSPEQLKTSVNAAIAQREIAGITEDYERQKKTVDDLAESIRRAENSADSRTAFGKAQIKKLIEEYKAEKNILASVEGKINDIKEAEQAARPKEERLSELQSELSLLTKEQGELDAIILKAGEATEQWKMFGWETTLHIARLEEVNGKIARVQEKINAINGGNTVAPVQNKAYWEKQKKDATEALDAMGEAAKGTEDWNKAMARLAEANNKLKIWDFSEKTRNRYENEAQKRVEAEQWLLNKQTEIGNERLKAELDREQKQLDLEEDSFEKRLKQIDLNYRKELLAAREHEANMAKEQQEAAKRMYIQKNGNDKGFDFATFDRNTLPEGLRPEDVQKQVKELTDAALAAQTKGLSEITKAATDQLEALRLEFASEHEQRLADINKHYDEEVKAAKGNAAILAALEENRQKEINKANREQAAETIRFEADLAVRRIQLEKEVSLFRATAREKELREQKRAVEESLRLLREQQAETPTDEVANDIAEATQELEAFNAELERMPGEKTREILESFQKIAGALGKLGGEVGAFFSNLSGTFDNILTAFDPAAKPIDKITAGLEGLIDLIGVVTSASAKRKEAEQEYYRNAIAMAHEYALALNEQIRTQSELSGSGFLTDYFGQINDGFKAMTDATDKYYEAMGKLSDGQAKIDLSNAVDWGSVGKGLGSGAATGAVIGSFIAPGLGTAIGGAIGAVVGGLTGLFGGKKKKEEYGGLLDVFPDLVDAAGQLNRALAEALINTDQVDEATSQLLQNALDWADAVEAAGEQIKAVTVDLAGDLGNNLREAIVGAWEAGTDASATMFDAAAQSLESFVENLLYSTLFSDIFKGFSDRLTESLKPTGDGDILDDYDWLMEQMDERDEAYVAYLDKLKKRADERGYSLWDDSEQKQQASTGPMKSVTQDSFDLWLGQFAAMRIHTGEIKEATLAIQGFLLAGLSKLDELAENTAFCRRLDRMDRNLEAIIQEGLKVA